MEAEVLGTVASTEAVATSESFRVGPFDDPDRYQIGEPVEAGAEGILYRGQLLTPTSRLSLPVAVKALQPAYSARIDQWAARWRDQVELLRSLQIPGLVGVREGFVGPLPHRQGAEVAGRNLYLVMNWVEGEALDHWVLHHRGVDVGNALKLLLPVAVAVDTMHGGQLTGSVPVVHRDIKPANILIGKGGSVLVDFGLTKGLLSGHPVGRAGTPGYIAPEVVAGGGYTPAADRYAFGATVFFLLTGRHPSTGTKPGELRHLLETPSTGGGEVIPPELVERVLAMLDPDPERRPTALANWIAQLRQSSLDDEALSVRLAPPAPARPRRFRGGVSARSGAPTGGSTAGSAGSTGPARSSARSGGRSAGRTAATAAAAAGSDATSRTSLASGPATGSPSTSRATPSAVTAGSDSDKRFRAPASATDGVEVGLESLAGAPPRRGGAHRAARRGPRHAQHQRLLASRYPLVAMLAVALVIVASDAGAVGRGPGRTSGSFQLRSTSGDPGGSSAAVTDDSRADRGGTKNALVEPVDVPGSSGLKDNGKPLPATTVPVAAPCYQSYLATCGALVWSPAVTNRTLTVHVSYSPQHPIAGQPVTFTVVLDDPDDAHNLQIDGAYFGGAGGTAGAAARPSAISSSPGCQTPHGTWPPPKPGGAGHLERQLTNTYANPGTYQVHFTASSGQDVSPCFPPDPYASMGSATQTVTVDAPAPPSTTTTTTTEPPPVETTTTVAPPGVSS
ncbi:MAG: eukaryotic-like serine/threonine-protein kinase [Acidimicrobiaceae bacterium]|jgi:serine/threonine protein kinase|nr:eukaryotic-like serine/threonine-protein kinase [Acidimicrobiaceae bacterium]MDQ1440157.1 eukaryotic-like serine/threonine-protein kinase [Acidimicrobiaceae bacterium]